MENRVICAITGRSYEEIGNGRTEIYSVNADIKMSINEKIRKLVDNGVTDFICHAEYGVPLWAAEYIIMLRDSQEENGQSPISLHILQVYKRQPFKWDYDIQDRFFNVLADADTVTTLKQPYSGYSYQKCERIMIESCNFLLTDDRGNFAAQYAELHGKPMIICDDVLMCV